MKPVSQLGQSHSLIATMWSVAVGVGGVGLVGQDPVDHNHCAFCHAEFAAARTDHVDFTAGYVTADDNYTWICQPCLEDLNAQLQWNVVSAPTDP